MGNRNQIRAGETRTAWLWGKIGKLVRGLQRIELERSPSQIELAFTGYLSLPKGNLPQEKGASQWTRGISGISIWPV